MPSNMEKPKPDEKDKGLESRYAELMLESSRASLRHNITALISVHLLLAGFLMLPGLSEKLQKSQEAQHIIPGQILSDVIQYKFLLATASCTFATSVGLIARMWWVKRENDYWLFYQLFLPCLIHTLQSLLSLLVNIDLVRARFLSIVEVSGLVVVSGSIVIFTMPTIYYFWRLQVLKKEPRTGT